MNDRAPMDPEMLGRLPGPEFPKGNFSSSKETEIREEKGTDQEVAVKIVQSRVKRGEKIDDIIQSLEEEMEAMEEKMKGKKGTQEWDDYSVMLNDKERQLQVAEQIKQGGSKGQSGETIFQTQQATADVAKKRAEAFAWAKSRAEEVRASYAKPYVKPPENIFSRFGGWVSSLFRQREAGKKIAEALTPALREQRASEEAARKETAAQNAAAYEARVFEKSRLKAGQKEKAEERVAK